MILPTKTRLKVEYIIDISIEKKVILKDVLYISDFKYNLLSVSSILKDKRYSLSFSNSNCIIQDKSLLKMIGKVELFSGLYLLKIKDERVKTTQSNILHCYVKPQHPYGTTE